MCAAVHLPPAPPSCPLVMTPVIFSFFVNTQAALSPVQKAEPVLKSTSLDCTAANNDTFVASSINVH